MEEDPLGRMAYDEALRALTQQQEGLDSLHARAGYLLTAAPVMAGLLFDPALSRHEGFPAVAWVASLLLGAAFGAASYAMWPAAWKFSTDAGELLAKWGDYPLEHLHRERAKQLAERYAQHETTLRRKWRALTVSVATLFLSLAALVYLIAGGSNAGPAAPTTPASVTTSSTSSTSTP